MELGASRGEIDETLGIAIYMGAGPSLMSASHTIDALEQFSKPANTPAVSAE